MSRIPVTVIMQLPSCRYYSSKYKVPSRGISRERSANLWWGSTTKVIRDGESSIYLGLELSTEEDVAILCLELCDSLLELRTEVLDKTGRISRKCQHRDAMRF